MHPDSKVKTAEDVDKLIKAELPDETNDPILFQLVRVSMLHGPCKVGDKDGPCIRDGKCGKYFPKKFRDRTVIDENEFPQYRHRNDSHLYIKRSIKLDNRYVVPYNPKLLVMFQGHINVEKTDQSNTIKYLFKRNYHKQRPCHCNTKQVCQSRGSTKPK